MRKGSDEIDFSDLMFRRGETRMISAVVGWETVVIKICLRTTI
jgi:hypothetical protein